MRIRSRLTAGLCSALALLVCAAPGSAAAADDDVFQPNARYLHPESERYHLGRIDVPREHDWYAISGLRTDEIVVLFPRVPPPTCPGRTPLLVSLYSPEGTWMRTVRVPTLDEDEDFGFAGPEIHGRYVLDVRASDPNCVGLEYFIGASLAGPQISGATASVSPSRGDICRFDRAVRIKAARRVSRQKRRVRRVHGKTRARHRRILRRYQRGVRAARAIERRSCGRSA